MNDRNKVKAYTMKFNRKKWNQIWNLITQWFLGNCSLPVRLGMAAAASAGLIFAVDAFYHPEPVSQLDVSSGSETEMVQEATASTASTALLKDTEPAWTPSLEKLNLAFFFPEGADTSDQTKSFGGQAFSELMTQDEQWMNEIYDYADMTPAQLAQKLGKDPSCVMGGYNPRDDRHDPDNPATWSVNTFKDIRMTAQDGDGNAIAPYSNVVEIMSMANTYSYYQNPEDYDSFLSYARTLWEQSHAYQVGISDVYYCSGCLSEEAERLEMEALEQQAKELELGLSQENPLLSSTEEYFTDESLLSDRSKGLNGPHEEETVSETNPNETILAGDFKNTKKSQLKQETEDETTAAVPESTSAVIVAPVKEKEPSSAAETESVTEETPTSPVLTVGAGMVPTAETAEETPSPESESSAEEGEEMAAADTAFRESEASETAASSSQEETATASDAAEEESKTNERSIQTGSICPGHVDLMIHIKITGLEEAEHSLFAKDPIGNRKTDETGTPWPGWNDAAKAATIQLSRQDWFEQYGLTVSNLSPGNPLTQEEINAYMALLPPDLSQTRRNLIQVALKSVGRVPYYWGGKPTAPDFASNRFGILTAPDYKGRVLKGLDCSGWISWVYWSATGKRLPYESTSGLAVLGKKINRKDLQPGDIIVRTGTEAHVVMFLGWTEDGRIRCIHESSSPVNNVTVAVRDVNWPYYRSLIED